MPTPKLKALNTKPRVVLRRDAPPEERERVNRERYEWREWDRVHQQRRSDPDFRHQARLHPGLRPATWLVAEDFQGDSLKSLRSHGDGIWCEWYSFCPLGDTYGWYSVWRESGWGEDIQFYERRKSRRRKRHPNQSAVFSPLQFMPKRRIAALYAAHAGHARSLAADFDEWDEDHQIRALIILSCGCYDREPGKS